MKVLDLHCEHQHAFEGWFGSEADFQDQLSRELVECPVCGSTRISKKLSAPRLNLSSPAAAPADDASRDVVVVNPGSAEMQAAWLKMVRHVMAHSEDVGERFAEEARRIHYGETEERNIRGKASAKETEALLEEGISVLPLPVPHSLKGPVH